MQQFQINKLTNSDRYKWNEKHKLNQNRGNARAREKKREREREKDTYESVEPSDTAARIRKKRYRNQDHERE